MEFIIQDGGCGEIIEKATKELNLEDFYDYNVLSKLLGITVGSLRHRIPNSGIECNQKGKRKYWLLRDVLAQYNVEYEKQ